MNCLECRRLLLATPRIRSELQQSHLNECAECLRLARGITGLDHAIEKAAWVRVPDSLAERVLLRRRFSPAWSPATRAIAATLIAALGVVIGYVSLDRFGERAVTLQAVGPTHPAVAAITLVADQEPWLLQDGEGADPRALQQAFARVGLTLDPRKVQARYLGKCGIDGNGDCDHVVLFTGEDHASVILLPDRAVTDRVLVADRSMTALLTPSGNGAYVLVASSPKAVKRAEKLLVKG